MIQKKYSFYTFNDLEKIISEIVQSDLYNNSSGVLLQLYNPRIDAEEEKIVDYINWNCDKACLIGITCANIADAEYDIKDNPIELNAVYFKTTRLYELDFDMKDATGFVAGRIVNEQLQDIPDARCMQVCYSCSSAAIHAFTYEFRHHSMPMFGAKAGRSIRDLNTAKVYGKRANANGIVAIIFAGENLHFYMDNCLGFKEIGVEMMVTGTEGDNIITTIDHKPATEVYSKYLSVKPNKYFVHNVCEFPLVFHRKECIVARVPAAYGEDGSIHFTSDVLKGETFRLSYGNADNLFHIINKSIKGIREFNPEAVLLFECGNRVRFLKDMAARETDAYLEYAPEAAIAYGYAELFIALTGDGGALNSALVAVGLTEDPYTPDVIRPCINLLDDTESVEDDRDYIPFVDRILNFLERTSIELDAINKDLGKIAYTDQLTKIYNRWELEHKINETIASSKEDSTPASLIFMDIDHFKHVNDTYGHDVGDMVLKAVVDIIRDNLQPQHVFGRWGGEEFIYVLPETGLHKAIEFAESLREQIDMNCFVTVKHVTMSFGVTQLKNGDTLEAFVKRADEGLYMAKECGRNRVFVNSD
ncbi:MAG: GGDEF domain-containing protein [Butyrivibrio sp.]|nr:GGDEF domain-containing protein [Butyrivibrio sp.]